jgi:hypothetical protein
MAARISGGGVRRRRALKNLRRQLRREDVCQAEQGRAAHLSFQDEGRLGLLGTLQRCWVPHPTSPVLGVWLERKYIGACSAVSPHEGVMDRLVLPRVLYNPLEKGWRYLVANTGVAPIESFESAPTNLL